MGFIMSIPQWLPDARFYQIFPDRFYRCEGYGMLTEGHVPLDSWDAEPTRENFLGGNIAGITEKLDYIHDLGCNAIYLNPIFSAATNHRYDANDYFKIDPLLGTLEDFHTLVDEAHKRNIRIVLDAVLNHCGKTHWMFQDVVKNEENSEYVNYFSVKNFPVKSLPVPNYKTCSGCEYLPKWNVFNPKVREHHFNVARYWIDQGIDGYRLDVPYFIYPEFWQDFRQVVKAKNSELCLIAEEWRDPAQWLQGDTTDSTMNYTLRDLVLGFTATKRFNAYDFVNGISRLQERIPYGYHHGMMNLLGSHDTERVLTAHQNNTEDCITAYCCMFACEGAPMIYYGDELGMVGDNDPGCRSGMQWDSLDTNAEIFRTIVQLNALRRDHIALRRGTQSCYAVDGDTVIISREHKEESLLMIISRSNLLEYNSSKLPQQLQNHNWRIINGVTVGDSWCPNKDSSMIVLQAQQ